MLALLAVGWSLSGVAVPLYDGLSFPQDAYRYAPARTGAPAATAAVAQLSVDQGINASGSVVNSAERGPQIQLYVPRGALRASAPIDLRAQPGPVAGSFTPGEPVSNVYAISATSPGGEVLINAAADRIRVTLRAAVHKVAPVMHYRAEPTEAWRALATFPLGHGSFVADAPGFGDYVLVRVSGGVANAGSPGTTSGSGGGGGAVWLLVGVLLLASVLASVVVTTQRRRADPAAPAESSG